MPTAGFYTGQNGISYRIAHVPGGWQLRINFSGRISGSDRMKVLAWLEAYRDQVRAQYPHWLLRAKIADDLILFDMLPAADPREMLARLTDSQQPQQLEFQYVA